MENEWKPVTIDTRNDGRFECYSLDTEVSNIHGIHLRPSKLIAQTALKYERKIYMEKIKDVKGEKLTREKFNCKSISDVISAESPLGTGLRVYVEIPRNGSASEQEAKESQRICFEMRDLLASDFEEAYLT